MREGKFAGKDGIELYYQAWPAELDSQPAKACIIVVHGFGQTCNSWCNILDYFPPRGYTVYVYEQRGFGRSPGQRGYINDWSEFREDLRCFVDFVKQETTGLNRYLICHSMGGVVAMDYALYYPETVSGVISIAPGIGKIGIPKILYPAAGLLNYILPRFSMENPMNPDLITRDKEWIKTFFADPLIHSRGTARLFWEIKKAGERVRGRAAEWRVPLLLLHGTADAFASIEGSREFFGKLTYQDVKFIEYEGSYHEPHNDIIKEQVFADMERWLEAHSKTIISVIKDK